MKWFPEADDQIISSGLPSMQSSTGYNFCQNEAYCMTRCRAPCQYKLYKRRKVILYCCLGFDIIDQTLKLVPDEKMFFKSPLLFAFAKVVEGKQ